VIKIFPQDKNHLHQEFSNLHIQNEETAIRFLKRFIITQTTAIIANNVYTHDETGDLFLGCIPQHKEYSLSLCLPGGEEALFLDIEHRLIAIDERSEYNQYINQKLNISSGLHVTEHTSADSKEHDNAVECKAIICFKCGKSGNTAIQCNEPKCSTSHPASLVRLNNNRCGNPEEISTMVHIKLKTTL
jgi:hypothetical protein